MTALLGVLGDPIAHSLSPVIHNGWLRDFGIDATYEAMHVREGALGPALETLAERNTIGLNVTLPHKTAALEGSQTCSEAARTIGAANTLSLRPSGWHADNSDAPGFLNALRSAYTKSLPDADVLVLGAGGSARAVVYALTGKVRSLTIANRTVERATTLSAQLTAGAAHAIGMETYQSYIRPGMIVINSTSLGHKGGLVALPQAKDQLFLDLSYGKAAKGQLTHARDQGWQTCDGLVMLVAQAAVSFEWWFECAPDQEKALQRCRTALEMTS